MIQTHVETAPFPRLRRPLNITVVGELGLTDGIAVFLDEGRVDFLIRERLDSSMLQLVRVDLAGFGEQADLNVQLVRVIPGSDTPYRKGWFHSGTWQPLHQKDRDVVESFLDQSDVLSRSVAVSDTTAVGIPNQHSLGATSTLSKSERTGAVEHSHPRADRDEFSGRARVRRSMRRASKRIAEERLASEQASANGRHERRASQPTPPAVAPGTRRSATENLRKGIAPADLVTPILSSVGGASLMATFGIGDRLERATNIGENWFRLVLGHVTGLGDLQSVQLLLQLPDGSFIQVPAKVLRQGPDRILLEAIQLDPMTLAVLRRAI